MEEYAGVKYSADASCMESDEAGSISLQYFWPAIAALPCGPSIFYLDDKTKKSQATCLRALFQSPSTPACFSLREKPRSAKDVASLFLCPLGKEKARRRPTLPLYAVPSALKGLTSVFEMGTGGTPSIRSPGKIIYRCLRTESSMSFLSLRAST